MAIKKDTIKDSVQFEYLFDNVDTGFLINVKYHVTEDYGDTVTFWLKDEQIDVPASFFTEVTDFLRNRGTLKSSVEVSKEPSIQVSSKRLPLPKVTSGTPQLKSEETTETLPISDSPPVESFSDLGGNIQKVAEIVEEKPKAEKVIIVEATEAETKAMLEERRLAVEKAATKEKKITRK